MYKVKVVSMQYHKHPKSLVRYMYVTSWVLHKKKYLCNNTSTQLNQYCRCFI